MKVLLMKALSQMGGLNYHLLAGFSRWHESSYFSAFMSEEVNVPPDTKMNRISLHWQRFYI
jgi:hypothetical protein